MPSLRLRCERGRLLLLKTRRECILQHWKIGCKSRRCRIEMIAAEVGGGADQSLRRRVSRRELTVLRC
jgi:hypothetical protein